MTHLQALCQLIEFLCLETMAYDFSSCHTAIHNKQPSFIILSSLCATNNLRNLHANISIQTTNKTVSNNITHSHAFWLRDRDPFELSLQSTLVCPRSLKPRVPTGRAPLHINNYKYFQCGTFFLLTISISKYDTTLIAHVMTCVTTKDSERNTLTFKRNLQKENTTELSSQDIMNNELSIAVHCSHKEICFKN